MIARKTLMTERLFDHLAQVTGPTSAAWVIGASHQRGA
jgi:hypothetical protein